MASKNSEIVIGMILAGLIQTLTTHSILLILLYVIYGFTISGNLLFISFITIWGILCFSSLGMIIGSQLKKVIPSGMLVLIINVSGWWIGGGLVPSEVWPSLIRNISKFWPGTYFFRSYTNLVLLNQYDNSQFLLDMAVTTFFGILMFIISIPVFIKESKI